LRAIADVLGQLLTFYVLFGMAAIGFAMMVAGTGGATAARSFLFVRPLRWVGGRIVAFGFGLFWAGLRFLLPLGNRTMHDVTFDWNGDTIHFSNWDHHAYGTFHYTTRDRSCDFTFDLQPVGREVRIYIVQQPSYGSQPSDGHSTHRLGIGSGRPYVCIEGGLKPTNVPDALSWAVYWAEQTADYIRTGRAFT